MGSQLTHVQLYVNALMHCFSCLTYSTLNIVRPQGMCGRGDQSRNEELLHLKLRATSDRFCVNHAK